MKQYGLMDNDNMFNKMMKLPLFQGASHEQIELLVEKLPFHFLTYNDGEKLIEAGDECDYLRFVVSGSVKIVTNSKVARVSVSQVIESPNVIGPDYLFGRHTCYPYDVFAVGKCGILQLRKSDYINILQADKVFLFNILNFLSRNTQNHVISSLSRSCGLVAERLAALIVSLTAAHSRCIKLNFNLRDLCALLGTRRATLTRTLHDLNEQGVIIFTANTITIPDRQLLLNLIKHHR